MGSVPPRAREMSASEVAVFETFVVPRYLSLFGERLLDQLVLGSDAQVVHLHCRTGYPDRAVVSLLADAHVYGVDASPAALELARVKATQKTGMVSEYKLFEGYPTEFPNAAFSHGISLHPLAAPRERERLLAELARLVAPAGQMLLALPLRGSFQEIADLIREYALKHEANDVTAAVEAAALVRPTPETLTAEAEKAGFEFVDVDVKPCTLKFQSGRDFFDDPITRLMLLPEFRLNLGLADFGAVMDYVRLAIDKYWSRSTFELGVQVGCVTGRRKS
ncbi:MAG: methyltransferase domain-containing protein [Myxococcales bacterium]|nr:methyltransferase domain-containing protein [Myxococcales bacterium]